MKKLTLQFPSLLMLANFAKLLNCGFITNTTNFTLTTNDLSLPDKYDLEKCQAKIIETTEKVFSYGEGSISV
ncbi:MAG TPA: hypothetical protein VGO09_01920 [Flavisolibacter sp.]|nr:hypothetical protein [Flavisolibacter sp.]